MFFVVHQLIFLCSVQLTGILHSSLTFSPIKVQRPIVVTLTDHRLDPRTDSTRLSFVRSLGLQLLLKAVSRKLPLLRCQAGCIRQLCNQIGAIHRTAHPSGLLHGDYDSRDDLASRI